MALALSLCVFAVLLCAVFVVRIWFFLRFYIDQDWAFVSVVSHWNPWAKQSENEPVRKHTENAVHPIRNAGEPMAWKRIMVINEKGAWTRKWVSMIYAHRLSTRCPVFGENNIEFRWNIHIFIENKFSPPRPNAVNVRCYVVCICKNYASIRSDTIGRE